MKSTMRVEGLRELQASLQQFKKSTARSVLERALRKAAAPVEAAAERLAPVDTGKLKASIQTRVIRTNAGKSAYGATMRAGGSKADAAAAARAANKEAAGRGASATVRVEATAPHAHFAEFGTSKQGASPFMGPALHSNRNAIIAGIKTELASEIKKTATRLAKRKAKSQ